MAAFTYKDYTESDEVKRLREEAEKYKEYIASQSVTDAKTALDLHEQNKVADWTGGTYGESLKEALNKINNREKFSYDLNGDALYQQYKDQYMTQGRMAMQDTMGQAAAMTGGYGNSYASTVGNQAYQGYLQKLNDVVPDLYNLALNKYNLEGQELKDQYSLLKDQYNTEYGQYRDQVTDWNTEAARLSDKYYNESNLDYSRYADQRDYTSNAYNTERTYDYGLYSDAYQRAFASYQEQEASRRASAQLALQREQFNAEMIAKGYTKDANGNWVAPEETAKYFLDEYEEKQFLSYIEEGTSDSIRKAKQYIETKRGKGMTDEQAKYWLGFIPEEEINPRNSSGSAAGALWGLYNALN